MLTNTIFKRWVGERANLAYLVGIPMLAPMAGSAISFMVIGALVWNCLGIAAGRLGYSISKPVAAYGLVLMAYVVLRATSVVTSSEPGYNSLDAFKSLQFLAFAPMVITLLSAPVNQSLTWLLRGASFGAIGGLGLAVLQVYGFGLMRAEGGAGNPGPFALLMATSAGFSLLLADRDDPTDRWLGVAGWACGFVGVLLSGSKGAVPAVLLTSGIAVHYLVRHHFSGLNTRSVLAGLFVLMLGFLVAAPVIQWRIVQLTDDFASMADGKFTRSTGSRIEMWNEGLIAFEKAPLFGHGFNLRSRIIEPSLRKKTGESAGSHLHNSFITDLTGNGIAGLFTHLLALMAPFFLFRSSGHRRDSARLRGVMVILISAYVVADMTNLTFGHDILDSYFVFIMAVIAAASNGARPDIPSTQ